MSVDLLLQTHAPKWCGAPFVATSQTADVVVVQSHAHDLAAHVVQQEVGIRMYHLTAQPWELRTCQQRRATWLGMEGGHMTEVALGLVEHLFATDHMRIVHIATGRYAQSLHIEVHVLHVLGSDIELVVEQAHHASLIDLQLSLTDFLGIAAVGHTHVTAEAQLHGKVGMLCLVA